MMDNCQQSSVQDPASAASAASAASSSSLSGALKRSRSPTSGTEPRAKRVRTKWTEFQSTELCRHFAENTTPTTPQIAVLAAKIGLTVKVVQTYFRNQRKELRKQQREADTPVPVRQENDSTPSVAIMIPHVSSLDGSPSQLVNSDDESTTPSEIIDEVVAEDQQVLEQTLDELFGDLIPDLSSDGMVFPADIDHFEEFTSVLPFNVQMDFITMMADYPSF